MRNNTFKSGIALALIFVLMAFDAPVETNNKAIEKSQQNNYSFEPCIIENSSFQDGEEVVYKLYYNLGFIWLAAGEVTFRVKDQGAQYHLSADGRTYSSYEWFFKVRDRYDTYVDKNTLLPKVAIRNIQEGKYTLYDKTTFDQNRYKAKSTRGKTKEKVESKTFDMGGCMHDILSMIYVTRNLNYDQMASGEKVPVKIFMDEEVWPLKVKYLGKDPRKKIKGMGRYRTIKFQPEVIAGEVFTENTEMNIWVSDDENKVPLLIESPVSVGKVKAVLKSYKGLKYDMACKVD